ncbi:MAG: YolD-like family protein [Anaerobacillus sp.]
MKRNKDIKVQTEVLAEIYIAMEFATEVRLDYHLGEKITSIGGTIHYLDFTSKKVRIVNRSNQVFCIPFSKIKSILLLKEKTLV